MQEDGTGIGTGNKTLSCLNLSANQIDDVGAKVMAESFLQYIDEVSGTLDNVMLQRNCISEEIGELFQGDSFENISIVIS